MTSINSKLEESMNIIEELVCKCSENADSLYTVNDLCTITGFTRATIFQYMSKNLITMEKINDRLMCNKHQKNKLLCIKLLSKHYGVNLAGVQLVLSILKHNHLGVRDFTDLIHMYASKAGMDTNYVDRRVSIYEKKYDKTNK